MKSQAPLIRALRWLLPSPLMTASLVAIWIALARSTSPGQVLVGVVLGVAVPHLTASVGLTSARVRRPLVVARFIMVVGYDVLVSNFEVAWGVVRWRWRRPTSVFVTVPLDLRDPTALTALAIVATVVPGTVWSELALDRSAVLIHAWNAPDEAAFVAHFKARYERPLQEIFE
jgi:multicomponent K+:H+ antiporter subunit E